MFLVKSINFIAMKTMRTLLVCLCVITQASCLKEEVKPKPETGTLHLDIGLFISVNEVNSQLKSTMQTEEFKVIICRGDGTEVMVYERAAEMPETIELATGDYYVEAHSDNDLPAAFDNPYYFGASDIFTIGSNQQQTILVNCELANTIVSVSYSDNIINGFTDYSTTVSSNTGSLVYAYNETRRGYFQPLPLEILVELSYLRPDGSDGTRTLSGSIPEALPNRHYEITVDASINEGMASFQILLDSTGMIVEVIEITQDPTDPPAGALGYGDLLITEIMYNPSALSDTYGEWIEIYNHSDHPVNLQNLVVARDTVNRHTIGAPIELAPGAFFVLMRSDTATDAANSYIYGSDLSLSNTGAVLSLYNQDTGTGAGALIFSVDYGSNGFPAGTGASIGLDPGMTNPADAISGTSWCTATSAYNTGDLGTPGMPNDVCQ